MHRLFVHMCQRILLLPLAFLDEFVILLMIELQCMFRTQPQLDQGLLLLASFFIGKIDLHLHKLLKGVGYLKPQAHKHACKRVAESELQVNCKAPRYLTS